MAATLEQITKMVQLADLAGVPVIMTAPEVRYLLNLVKIYREALEIYADTNNWAVYDGAHWAGPDPFDDGYRLAKHALAWPEVVWPKPTGVEDVT